MTPTKHSFKCFDKLSKYIAYLAVLVYCTFLLKIKRVYGNIYTGCSERRLLRLLTMSCRVAAFFSASGAALSQEVPTV
jgi:hypothetical protein